MLHCGTPEERKDPEALLRDLVSGNIDDYGRLRTILWNTAKATDGKDEVDVSLLLPLLLLRPSSSSMGGWMPGSQSLRKSCWPFSRFRHHQLAVRMPANACFSLPLPFLFWSSCGYPLRSEKKLHSFKNVHTGPSVTPQVAPPKSHSVDSLSYSVGGPPYSGDGKSLVAFEVAPPLKLVSKLLLERATTVLCDETMYASMDGR